MSIFTGTGTGHGGCKGGFRSFADSGGTTIFGAVAEGLLLSPHCPLFCVDSGHIINNRLSRIFTLCRPRVEMLDRIDSRQLIVPVRWTLESLRQAFAPGFLLPNPPVRQKPPAFSAVLPERTYSVSPDPRYLSQMEISTTYMAWLMKRKQEAFTNAPLGFFARRGQLTLSRDASAHRRYSYIYEDLLE